jgi:hypothetical protein
MKPNAKSFKRPVIAFAAAALCVAAGSAPAAAQSERCADLYNRVMGLYQTAPYSPEYSRISAYYNSRCLTGPSAGPAYPTPYQAPYQSYQEPVALFPGAVIVGGGSQGDYGYRRGGEGGYYR